MNFKYILLLIMFPFAFNLSADNGTDKLFSVKDYNTLVEAGENYALIDIRKEEEFIKGHLPGAVNIWRSDYVDSSKEYGGVMASKNDVEVLLSSLGVNSDQMIVLYDNRGGCEAARFWWILKCYGHTNAVVLDGGYDDYVNSGNEFSVELKAVDKTDFVFSGEENRTCFASLGDVKQAMGDPNSILVDTRTRDEYLGEKQKKGAFKKGRIPGSVHFDWANSINYDGDKNVKSKEDIKNLLEAKGITKDKNIIVYCQSGVRSAHTAYVLTELMGYSNVKNYDGSWIEWSYVGDLPIAEGEEIVNTDLIEDIKEEEVVEKKSVSYWVLFKSSFSAYANYVWSEITFQTSPWYVNYFWLLIILSVVVWLLELAFPWRKDQPIVRTDFWIDAFYMFFNFFIFNLVIFIAFCNLTSQIFSDIFGGDLSGLAIINIQNYPEWAQLLIFFIAMDFVQWFTHVMLHRFPFLWKFHKVHHSVEQMGFAAHLRYHWMENVFYTPMKYIMVMLIGGFHPEQAFIVYYIAVAIGHINHANIGIDYGPLKYILNNPKMHIWHHAYELPEDFSRGANFGISLSIWDYIFRTSYIPHSGKDIRLGFENIEQFPKTFVKQLFSGFGK